MKKKLYKPILIISIFVLIARQSFCAFGDTVRPVAAVERSGSDITRSSYVISADVGGTQMSAGVVDAGGKMVEVADTKGRKILKLEVNTDIPSHIKDVDIGGGVMTIQALDSPAKIKAKDDVVEKIARLILRAGAETGMKPEDIKLVGLGSPGDIDPYGFVRLAYNVPFQGINLSQAVTSKVRELGAVHATVYVVNDMLAALAGEAVQDYTRGFRRITYFTISTGVNAAEYDRETGAGNNLETGTEKVNESNGILTFTPDGAVTFESLTSGRAIAEMAREKIREERAGKILELADSNTDKITAKEVGMAALQGDPLALEIIDQVGNYLGQGIVELTRRYQEKMEAPADEELFVLGGGVTLNGEPLKQAIERGIQKARSRVTDVKLPRIKIVFSVIGSNRAIVGVAAIARKRAAKAALQAPQPLPPAATRETGSGI
ncbi:MAG: ROK family protein [Candidatus Omnitrophica bacterium]|nr:ROK family protein [Candidatus Omnitrophota bacterium]